MPDLDGIIDLANELLHDREAGKVVSLAAVVVYSDGSSQWCLRGEVRPRPIIFELEAMKMQILMDDAKR